MARKSNPQDKKKESLKRDGRNCYAESDKGSRKTIPRNKARVNRSFRRETKQSLSRTHEDQDLLQQEVSEIKRDGWKKVPDRPLGELIRDQFVRQILDRVSAVIPNADKLLSALEMSLLRDGMPFVSVRKIVGQLRDLTRNLGLRGDHTEVFEMDVNDAEKILKSLKTIK